MILVNGLSLEIKIVLKLFTRDGRGLDGVEE